MKDDEMPSMQLKISCSKCDSPLQAIWKMEATAEGLLRVWIVKCTEKECDYNYPFKFPTLFLLSRIFGN